MDRIQIRIPLKDVCNSPEKLVWNSKQFRSVWFGMRVIDMVLSSKASIGRRLTIGFGIPVVLSAAIGFAGIKVNLNFANTNNEIHTTTALLSRKTSEIHSDLLRMHRSMKDVAMAPSSVAAIHALAEVNLSENMVFSAIDTIAIFDDTDQRDLKEFRANFVAWKSIRSEVASLKSTGREIEAAIITRGKGAEHLASLEKQIMALGGAIEAKRIASELFYEEAQQSAYRKLAAFSVLTALLTGFIALWTARYLVTPLNLLANFANGIRHGDLNVRLKLDRTDEIGAVGDALDNMASSLQLTREELNDHQKNLEERVVKRTADLVKANKILKAEFELREKMTAQYKESEERLHTMTTGSNDGFWDWHNMDHPDVWWSPRLYELLDQNPDSFLPNIPSFKSLTHPDDRALLNAAIQKGVDSDDELELKIRIKAIGGQYRWFELRAQVLREPDGKARRMSGIIQDIHDRKWAEDEIVKMNRELQSMNEVLKSNQNQLIQAEKMSSLGQLAAGVAHEINNPVGFISSNLGTMLEYTKAVNELITPLLTSTEPDSDPLSKKEIRSCLQEILANEDYGFLMSDTTELLNESLEGTKRISEIVNSLKSFAHPDSDVFSSAQINKGLETSLKIVWNKLKYHCEITKDFAELPRIYCNIGRLNQVFMNLMVNAAHATGKDGKITIRTTHHDEHIVIEISDNRKGISEVDQLHIFDPFFTTKPVGEGTGLGLSISHSIIRDHSGSISVMSAPGQGTTFTIRIPDDLKPDDVPVDESQATEVSI